LDQGAVDVTSISAFKVNWIGWGRRLRARMGFFMD